VFSNNHASAAHSRNKIHDTIYSSQIKGEVWSKPFTNGYNNYDISYVFGTPILFYNVTVRDSYAELTGEDTYISGALVTIAVQLFINYDVFLIFFFPRAFVCK
jgi:hypothetical protein